MKRELFLEDFAVGEVVASPQRLRVEKDDIIAFARKFDPQYFHLDEEAARHSIFGGLVASGWHTAAMTMRLLTERDTVPAGGSVGLGCDEMRWPIPVRPGDELHIETEVLEIRPSRSRPDRGLVKMTSKLTLVLAVPYLTRFAIQLPLFLAGQVILLGVAKVVLGWPMLIAALAVIGLMLSKGKTPIEDSALAGPASTGISPRNESPTQKPTFT